MPDDDFDSALLPPTTTHPYNEMKDSVVGSRPKNMMNKISLVQTLSYVFDWVILIIVGVIGVILGNITPNKRPFSLQDPNISYVLVPVPVPVPVPVLRRSVITELVLEWGR